MVHLSREESFAQLREFNCTIPELMSKLPLSEESHQHDPSSALVVVSEVEPKRKRGRPRKYPIHEYPQVPLSTPLNY